MLTDSEHFLIKRVNVNRKDDSFELEYLVSDYQRPLKDTAVGVCIATQMQHYTPRTEESEFDTQRVAKQLNGINSVLATPILVNGNKAAGAIILLREEKDGFKKPDRVLISDIALMLGQNLYAKRLLEEANESKKRSREMLHSFVPPKVLDKIECYWDNNSEEYRKTRSECLYTSNTTKSSTFSNHERSNTWYVAADDWSEEDKPQDPPSSPLTETIKLIRDINRADDDIHDDNVGVLVSKPRIDFTPTSRALYAENVKNVCIIFSDIVGFSQMSMNLSPSSVMDMLQNLFNRFDDLCDLHGVLKLETIGDGYICATNLLDDHDNSIENAQDAAVRALEMAKEMVTETTFVQVPSPESEADPLEPTDFVNTLQIRVGIHVGDITCGVLGQRLPKFTTCGKAVNMAARMEQTSSPSCIRVTKEFHDLVGDKETGWNEKELTVLKNMGEKETYLLDPEEC